MFGERVNVHILRTGEGAENRRVRGANREIMPLLTSGRKLITFRTNDSCFVVFVALLTGLLISCYFNGGFYALFHHCSPG